MWGSWAQSMNGAGQSAECRVKCVHVSGLTVLQQGIFNAKRRRKSFIKKKIQVAYLSAHTHSQ